MREGMSRSFARTTGHYLTSLQGGCTMYGTLNPDELSALTEVLKEHLTDLRGEILETDDVASRQMMHQKEEILRTILLKFERHKEAVNRFQKV